MTGDAFGGAPTKTIRAQNSQFQVLNNAYSSPLLTLSESGTLTIPGVFVSGASVGLSVTKTVRDAAGTGTCTLIFTGGILTGGTC